MPMKSILARPIFDSRGHPTVEVDLITDLGLFRAAVPSGSNKGKYEAAELRDGEKKNYHGQGVNKAVKNINETIAPALLKEQFEVIQQAEVDEFLIDLDGTPNKSNLGSNAILAVSLAVAKAGAAKRGLPLYRHIADLAGNKDLILPVPAFNVVDGGLHAGNKLAIQEFLILPTGAKSFKEAMKMGTEVYHWLRMQIIAKFGKKSKTCSSVGEEGGFAPETKKPNDVLQLIKKAIQKAGYTGRVEVGIDAAASAFFKKGKYDLDFKNPKSKPKTWLTSAKLMKQYQAFIKKFPVVSIEDPFDQDDFASWVKMKNALDIQVVADALCSSNLQRIQDAAEKDAANCLLLKMNSVGTVTEAIKAHLTAKEMGWGTMVSHRSGETEDTFIADLAVGLSTGQIKAGAPCRSERLAKLNQLLRIEEELGSKARYAGRAFQKPQ